MKFNAKTKFVSVGILFGVFFGGVLQVLAADKIKTLDFLAGFSAGQISASTSTIFSVYIGDNLSGVVNPIKSAVVEVSGVYTGGGTLGISLDSDPASLRTYTLPSVSGPTKFEIIYNDPSGIINPASAGVYIHNFDLSPSGVVLSGVASVARVTHRYKPPSCGTGYPAFGDLTSAIFEMTTTGVKPAYNSVFWKGLLGGPLQNQGKVKFRFAAADTSAGPWNDSDFVGGADCNSTSWFETTGPDEPVEIKCFANLNNKRFFRYKVRVCSNDCQTGGDFTPTVQDVIVSWSP